MKTSKEQRVNIRLEKQQYERVCKDAESYGETPPGIMKSVYFSNLPVAPNFCKDDQIKFVNAINWVGNTLNKIARQVNSGSQGNLRPLRS